MTLNSNQTKSKEKKNSFQSVGYGQSMSSCSRPLDRGEYMLLIGPESQSPKQSKQPRRLLM